MTEREARVVFFSYGGLVKDVVGLLRDLGSTPVALVIPSNRPTEAIAAAREDGIATGLAVLEQPAHREIVPFLRVLSDLQPDLFLIWSYSMILAPEVVRVPERGCVNVHGGLLPEYRGAHVLQWALINGEAETGVTLHFVDEGIDTGPIIARQTFPIDDEDDAASVASKLREVGLAALREHWPAIVAGAATTMPQSGDARYWRLRRPEDGEIRWDGTAESVRNLVRALVRPWPGAFTRIGDTTLHVDRVAIVSGRPAPPGTVTYVAADKLVISAQDASVAILEARLDGERVDLDTLGVAVDDVLGT